MMTRIAVGLVLAFILSACGGASPGATTDPSSDFTQWRLPDRLREISGLALTPDQRLFAITDEEAFVYELDFADGAIVKRFALGDPVLRGDFEGIAVLDERVWLMTSDGDLLVAAEGSDGSNVDYKKFKTGHGADCELEGLTQDRENGALLLACKESRSDAKPLRAFEWSVSKEDIEFSREIFLPEKAIARKIDAKRFNPSGIALDPLTREWVVIAARQHVLVRLSAGGEQTEAIIRLKKRRHRQAEGIEVTSDGRLLIADEGGDGKARLAVYNVELWGNDEDE
jgi:uncharacterized protein YjiK